MKMFNLMLIYSPLTNQNQLISNDHRHLLIYFQALNLLKFFRITYIIFFFHANIL